MLATPRGRETVRAGGQRGFFHTLGVTPDAGARLPARRRSGGAARTVGSPRSILAGSGSPDAARSRPRHHAERRHHTMVGVLPPDSISVRAAAPRCGRRFTPAGACDLRGAVTTCSASARLKAGVTADCRRPPDAAIARRLEASISGFQPGTRAPRAGPSPTSSWATCTHPAAAVRRRRPVARSSPARTSPARCSPAPNRAPRACRAVVRWAPRAARLLRQLPRPNSSHARRPEASLGSHPRRAAPCGCLTADPARHAPLHAVPASAWA